MNDNCRAIDLVLQNGKPGEVYNIGGNCEKKNLEVVNQICSILEEKSKQYPSLITRHSSPVVGSLITDYSSLYELLTRYSSLVTALITGEYQEYYEKIYGRDG